MSLNNYILIKEISPDTFTISSVDADGGVGIFCTDEPVIGLREAISIAKEQESEYGIDFSLLSKHQEQVIKDVKQIVRENKDVLNALGNE